ncbi:type VI secretion system-associated FHA domain protein TagH [Kalamiella sp. sgz302252]|uniref:type VI secretion system-associated FHA domain protein TagH n=1 Tax=Pantoea sp. sgz302252 TaxID=3341827 RepID=UPI0036D43BC9
MRFTIITAKPGQRPPQQWVDFLPPGGTIGRGSDNNLILPDESRTISRFQAIVHVAADGECRISSRGNVTRILLNNTPLGQDAQAVLKGGDVLGIGEYRLMVSAVGCPPEESLHPIAAGTVDVQPALAAAVKQPASAIPSEIWDSLVQEFAPAASPVARPAEPASAVTANPLTAAAEPERNPEDPLSRLPEGDSILDRSQSHNPDDLFTGETLFDGKSIFADLSPSTLECPSATAPQARPDPLALFGEASSGGPAKPDDSDPLGLMLNGGRPLTGTTAAAVAAPSAQRDPAIKATLSPELAELSASPLFSGMPDAESVSEKAAAGREFGGIALPIPQAIPQKAERPNGGRLRIDPLGPARPSASRAAGVTPQDGEKGASLQGELLQALIDGMGLNDLQPVPQLDKEQLYQLGQMFSMFSQGTVALLSSRSILKRGVKAEMTVILDEANNPFKLLPSGKSVLMQMYGSRMPGFMVPVQSVRDALIDLQAHQLGMIAGIRAIIASMLQSFNPEQLQAEVQEEKRAARFDFSVRRKAAFWDHFTRRYQETAGEIEDDFHTLFGEAFLHAYDMEVNQYKDSQNRSEHDKY